jgi:outer membrane protein
MSLQKGLWSLSRGLWPLAVCSAYLTVSQAAFAQAAAPGPAKVGIVNLQQAVYGTAETKKANDDMNAKFKPRQDAIDQLNKEIATLANQLQTGQGKLTPQAEADIQAQGQKKQRDLQRAQDDLQADATAYRNEALQKMSQKMVDVIKKMAEAKGYDVVVDASSTVYFKGALDITKDAIAEYDKTYPAK